MNIFLVFLWLFIGILIIGTPLEMRKIGTNMTGRDLCFVFIGMVTMSGFSLIALFY